MIQITETVLLHFIQHILVLEDWFPCPIYFNSLGRLMQNVTYLVISKTCIKL